MALHFLALISTVFLKESKNIFPLRWSNEFFIQQLELFTRNVKRIMNIDKPINFLRFSYFITINSMLLRLQIIKKMLQITKTCRTSIGQRDIFWESPFVCGPGGPLPHPLFPSYSKATSFHFFPFSVQLQSGTDFSAYSKKHMVWASSLKIFVWPGRLWGASGFPRCPLVCKHPGHLPKWNPGSSMCTIFVSVLTDQWLRRLSHNNWWWICHFPSLKWLLSQYGYEQCDTAVSSAFLSFNPVNPCCLVLWSNILVILKELRMSECCMQLLCIVSSFEIK